MAWRTVILDDDVSRGGLRLLRDAVEDQMRARYPTLPSHDLTELVKRKVQAEFDQIRSEVDEIDNAMPVADGEEFTHSAYGVVMVLRISKVRGESAVQLIRVRR